MTAAAWAALKIIAGVGALVVACIVGLAVAARYGSKR